MSYGTRTLTKPCTESGIGPASHTGLSVATTTQVRNKTGRINWKRAKRNLETHYGLRLGILNVGTLREKEEEIALLMEQRNLKILGISETREKITGK